MEAAIHLDRVSKRFVLRHRRPRSFQELMVGLLGRQGRAEGPDALWALKDVDLAVETGEMVGLIGPNGAGKSTVLQIISRIIVPTSGTVDVTGRVGGLLELGAGFHPDLSGRENIYLSGSILGLNRSEIEGRLDDIIAFSELERFIDGPVKHYSSGMHMRLGFSIAVHLDPDILLIDEVLAVGDAEFQLKCLDRIAQLRRRGITIVLVSHNLGMIETLCDRAIWLEEGEIEAQGRPLDVLMAYRERIAQKAEDQVPPAPADFEEGRRWGIGGLLIERVDLCDDAGQRRETFVTGEAMEIRIHYRATRRVAEPIFGLAIFHQDGAHICGPNTRFGGLPIPALERGERGVVSYRIPSLPLLEGTYRVTVAATNQSDTAAYDYHDRAYRFRVRPGRSLERYGLVTLDGRWRLQQLSERTKML